MSKLGWKKLRCTSNNVELTDIVRKYPWNYLHSQNHKQKNDLKRNRILWKKIVFYFLIFLAKILSCHFWDVLLLEKSIVL